MPYHILTTSIFPDKPQSIQLSFQAARDGSSDVTQLRGVCFPLGKSELHSKASAKQLNSAGRGQLTPTGKTAWSGLQAEVRQRDPARHLASGRGAAAAPGPVCGPPASLRRRDVRSFHFEPQAVHEWEKAAVRDPGCRSPGRGGSSCSGLAPVITFLWLDVAEQSWALPPCAEVGTQNTERGKSGEIQSQI